MWVFENNCSGGGDYTFPAQDAAAFLAGAVILCLFGGLNPPRAVIAALPAAAVGAAAELLSPSEWDTVTVPLVILTVLMLTAA